MQNSRQVNPLRPLQEGMMECEFAPVRRTPPTWTGAPAAGSASSTAEVISVRARTTSPGGAGLARVNWHGADMRLVCRERASHHCPVESCPR